ncbi:hypothetical protein KAJ38_02745 [Candidatus Pacearchaeota archaeon]|nr:hypothetical protein [Candidatus Pacearchaeota archaeon]
MAIEDYFPSYPKKIKRNVFVIEARTGLGPIQYYVTVTGADRVEVREKTSVEESSKRAEEVINTLRGKGYSVEKFGPIGGI